MYIVTHGSWYLHYSMMISIVIVTITTVICVIIKASEAQFNVKTDQMPYKALKFESPGKPFSNIAWSFRESEEQLREPSVDAFRAPGVQDLGFWAMGLEFRVRAQFRVFYQVFSAAEKTHF